MNKLYRGVVGFFKDEEGVTAIEYGLIAALIAVAIIAGTALLGGNLNTLFTNIANCLTNPAAGCMDGE
ncbi:MAG: Flp family type IVb pilin [Gallionella sp.]|nr:Flp family type IVb pilin [Gallionella sp.]